LISNWAINKVLNKIKLFWKEDRLKEEYYPVICASRIGNCPMPSISPLIYTGSGFIQIPVDSIYYPESLFYILHEAGHILTCEYLLLSNIKKENDDEFYDLDEALSDLFAICIAFRGDKDKYMTLLFNYYSWLHGGNSGENAKIFRNLMVNFLFALKDEIDDPCDNHFKKQREIISSNKQLDPELIKRAERAFDKYKEIIFKNDPHFKVLIKSYWELSKNQRTGEENDIVFDELYKFLIGEINDDKRREFLHYMWLLCYKIAIKN
jgi:hypothetical protein